MEATFSLSFHNLLQPFTSYKIFESYPILPWSFHPLSFDPILPSRVDLKPNVDKLIRTPNLLSSLIYLWPSKS